MFKLVALTHDYHIAKDEKQNGVSVEIRFYGYIASDSVHEDKIRKAITPKTMKMIKQ